MGLNNVSEMVMSAIHPSYAVKVLTPIQNLAV
jgi:hypothetical protein